mmetsp:Transcript_18315/g.27930  ORF Transcript_18315/g.27930 Transcript_18315/m.27930 type:complete len:309 (-) Transcript_18315:1125-2051(-)|eukprot:CAMPEP_0118703236 /NCGR_PEP_ID=MMETSP0800-20121206/18414_1 /TAXON_ID=210618 ORGANISM="Striatella unipunctata, Strain CCMP2910" /NCGR_SAMPLE_ID=MMETSP0800 /ASSEMBLY_ACC=CAM_ASM_000638 /LENGTH=308 /DNA_ID=CAMNT_0006604685 /DNA_START=177 /DNA_END=1103 /DNA_ORIENTATION=-
MIRFSLDYVLPVLLIFTATRTTTNLFVQGTPSNKQHVSTALKQSSFLNKLKLMLQQDYALAQWEQEVEDYNAGYIKACSKSRAESLSRRRLVVLPLNEKFDPAPGMFSHGHVQTGDKMSLPKDFWQAIAESKAQVPWLFRVSKVKSFPMKKVTTLEQEDDDDEEQEEEQQQDDKKALDSIVGGAIDFRAPANYCFLPLWMMRALKMKPMDVVDVRLDMTVPPGSSVKLRPHDAERFAKLTNPQAILETELKHYSALCINTVIAFDYQNERHFFDVVELRRAPKGEKVPMAKVQDCDIAAEFVVPKKKK